MPNVATVVGAATVAATADMEVTAGSAFEWAMAGTGAMVAMASVTDPTVPITEDITTIDTMDTADITDTMDIIPTSTAITCITEDIGIINI